MTKRWLVPLLTGVAAMAAFGQDTTAVVAPVQAAVSAVSADSAMTVATEASTKADVAAFIAHNIWMMISAILVFIMALGFAGVETGLTRAKNTSNILFKNVVTVGIGVLTYAIVGFNLMYPGAAGAGGFFVFPSFGLTLPEGPSIGYASGHYTYWTDFIFQAMFAATAATIVSGAVAERIKLSSFLLFSIPFVGLVYPAVGMWKWGGGWLAAMGFWDFAGSTLVHSVGGWGALAGVIVLGPRIGKYVGNQIRPIMGHSMPLATIGVFMLWFGWYGFNGGSVLSADPDGVSFVFVTTTLGAVGGMLSSLILSWIIAKAPDLSMMLNGILAGLVGITAGADIISPMEALLIGGVAGILAVLAVYFFDKIKLDDPVGALSVHLVGGIWGTLATGIFGNADGVTFLTQLKGVLAYGAVVFPISLVFFLILKYTVGLRVSREEELGGLDKSEHKSEAYGGFNIFH